MTKNYPTADDAAALLAVLRNAETQRAARILAFLVLVFGKPPGARVQPQPRGEALHIYIDDVLCFVFEPSASGVTARMLEAEMSKCRINVVQLSARLPDLVTETEEGELIVTLHTIEQAQTLETAARRAG